MVTRTRLNVMFTYIARLVIQCVRDETQVLTKKGFLILWFPAFLY
jgi:hypothetical protein